MDIITSIAMFYDLEDPVAFAKNIKNILAPEGIWIFEMSYMPTMLKMNSYDTICHEHLEFYSLAVIEYILKQSGMKVFNVTLNDINGGSFRCHATHAINFRYKNQQYLQNIEVLHQSEFDLDLDTDKPYKNFQDRINVHRDELITLLKKIRTEGKKFTYTVRRPKVIPSCNGVGSIIELLTTLPKGAPINMVHTLWVQIFQLLARRNRVR